MKLILHTITINAAIIGLTRVSACEIEEKPTKTKKLSLEERKALAESILEYCMETKVAGKERDAKIKKNHKRVERIP